MSNFEKIKAMNLDEMAKFLCMGDRSCEGCAFKERPQLCSDAVEVFKQWLEDEASTQ